MKPLSPIAIDDIQIFCRAVESDHFTAASISLGVTPSAVSKAIKRLEQRLKVKLFHRSTRVMRLTEAGQRYYDVCRDSLGRIEAIEQQLIHHAQPQGTLRISLPDSLAIFHLIPVINDFIEAHLGQLKVEIVLSTSYVDFMREDIDLALRIGDVGNDQLIARPFDQLEQKIVTSPRYLAKYGTPKTLADLSHHHCVGLKFPGMPTVLPWRVDEGRALPLTHTVQYSDPLGALTSVIEGFGIIQLLDFSVKEGLNNGTLVELFSDHRPPPLSVNIVYLSGYLPAKVRVFIDHLFAHAPRRCN
ncbi:LysR family transcriptional regulator [Wohlfahrtiimonas chitiniclastica]|uniref:LysR family transcriptional regulator n=1 Tax=Wohlfahrtiimonas chitiniclastica TaxID=400946 RepID=UPI00036F5120|nr:LysR family transcriptional regulator [Wohlfahrtiimonas chitiniclastica]